MNAPPHEPWTQEQLFPCAEVRTARRELDGFRPVAVTGGTAQHPAIGVNVLTA